jgi:glycosyltransferase involved in cell wall biosynthesis
MNIGINLLFLKQGIAGGTETYTFGLLKGLSELADADSYKFFIFCNEKLNLDLLANHQNFEIIRYAKIAQSVRYRVFFEQFLFPFKIKKYKLDLLHSLGYTGPVFQKNHLVTIHDTNAFVHEDMPGLKKKMLAFFMASVAKKCDHILTVSHFSKKEIIHFLKVPAKKISVVYEASKYDQNTVAESLPDDFIFLKASPYFIALSSVTKNKNIITLLQAFKKVVANFPEYKLVLAGFMPPDNSILAYADEAGLTGKIISTGFIGDNILISLFKNSYGFIFPSLYEGFGLPLLEAQNLGVPVISSNKGSLPEVGGDSVLYFEGKDAGELADKMQELITNKNLGSSLIEQGYKNTNRFSWPETAKQTLDIYKKYKTEKHA